MRDFFQVIIMFDMNYYFGFDVSKYIIKLQNYIIYKIFYFRIYTYILMLQRHHCILCVFCKSYICCVGETKKLFGRF